MLILWLLPHLLFASLTSFELLNYAKLLHFPLHFSWLALVLPAAVGWLTWYCLNRALKKSHSQNMAIQAGILILISLYADILGNLAGFYSQFFWYDKLTHFWGGVSAASVLFALLWHWQKLGKIKLPLTWLVVFVISLAISTAVIYEFEEYFEDYFNQTHKISDRFDTSDDLMWHFLGASLTATSLALFNRRKEAPSFLRLKKNT